MVAEITFGESASGSAIMQGSFVSAETGKSTAPSIFGRRFDGGDSRDLTIANARRRIQALATAVGIQGEHAVETALRWYRLALQHSFTRGRSGPAVVAACLYIVCRQEKTSHMLLDFADVLEQSVYMLGGTFLRLVRLLNLEIPIIDPSFFVGRFAAKLGFGERTQAVANTALRVVARMKRDWIQTGRRPAGVCGGALVVAARFHGFRRTNAEVRSVVRVCEATLRKRLEEFGQTPSSLLTPDEFEGIWLEGEEDPPAFKRARQQETSEAEDAANLLPLGEGGVRAATPTPEQMQVLLKETFSDLDEDEEVTGVLLEEAEVEMKTRLWTSLNQDYLDQQAAKEAEKMAMALEAEAAAAAATAAHPTIKTPIADLDQVALEKAAAYRAYRDENNAPPAAKKPRTRKAKGEEKRPVADTAAEAAKQMLATKRFSKRINYEVVEELFRLPQANKK